MIQLGHGTVGVAPGTTTLALGDPGMVLDPASCPPDEWPVTAYVAMPQVTEGMPPGVDPSVTVVPPQRWYNAARNAIVPGLGAHHHHMWDPYEDAMALKGLGGTFGSQLGNASWGLVGLVGVTAFALAFGVFYWKGRHGKRR